MNRVRMRTTVLFGPERKRLERGKEYEVPNASSLVPRYAEYVGEPPSAENDGDGTVVLDQLTVAQLKELAAERGIELTATKKADIVAELEAALGA